MPVLDVVLEHLRSAELDGVVEVSVGGDEVVVVVYVGGEQQLDR